MKYGIILPEGGPMATPENLGAMARRAEELGYDSLSAGDRILMPRGIGLTYPYDKSGEYPDRGPGESMELLTLMSFLAGRTSKIRLVTAVVVVPHRNPLLAAKALATLDVLSQGRLVLGIGVGWMPEEFEALGLPPFEERGAVTDEYIRAFKELWTSDYPSFEGKYIRFDNISFLPHPVQKPHPPIWVGGESRPALRRTAELANGWYPLGGNPTYPVDTPEQLAAGIQRLGTYARRFGRDPAEIDVIYGPRQFELKKDSGGSADGRLPFVGTADQVASDIRRYQEMGVSSLIFDFIGQSEDVDQVNSRMEEFATSVWPKV